jgi:hypothetical protein
MAKTRSPNYPSVDLSRALEAIKPVFAAENRNKFSRLVLAEHLGYSSLNGRALAKIGAVRAYGLIEGAGDDLRLSEDAIIALVAPPETEERRAALGRLALKPTLFQELSQEFQGLPSESNLRFWLIKRHFTPDAAGKAAATYLSTMQLVPGSSEAYGAPPKQEETDMPQPAANQDVSWIAAASRPRLAQAGARAPAMLQEVFNLDEGPVTLTFPAYLSSESFGDLSDQLELFLRRAKRRAAAPKDAEDEDR